MMKDFGAKYEHTEGIAEAIRSIKEVEIAVVLKENFTHYCKEKGKKWYLFDTGQQIIPDYISKDRTIVADAKYIALNKEGSYKNEEKATAIYYKTITYMYRWNAKIGLLLYPIANSNSVLESRHKIVDTEGCVIKVGFPIPKSEGTFSEFSETMRAHEILYSAHLQKIKL